jgi:DNA mismatch repair protein MutS2
VARLSCRPKVYADIGDEQSVIANLSTFSGHLTRIKQFLDDLLPGSLVVLDELGTGTDPAEGAALGIAVLEHLANLEAMTIVSTHHDALKAFAHSSKCSVNASMEFDSESLQPTYTLRIGRPGRSNAFDIAETLGLEASLVERARGLVDINAAQLDSLIRSVENEAEALASDREEVQEQQSGLEKAHAQYESLSRELVELRQSLVNDGRVAIDEAIKRLRSRGDSMLTALSKELDETRKSRTAQDRRARWAARIGDADADARRVLDAAVDASVWTMEKLRPDIDILAADTVQEAHTEGAGETLQIDDNLEAPLKRGQLVLVKPLNLRGQVVRNWVGDPKSEASVEVDVHGKRLIVSREQVRLLVV